MANSFIKNNIFILIGNVLFRIGGYIYKFLMVYLLDQFSYGLLTITFPIQNMLQIFAAGGLPPALSKYISEYNAKNQQQTVNKYIKVSFKLVLIIGLLCGILMFWIISPLICKLYNLEKLLLPLQMISFIIPFSAIVAVFRGIFQGIFEMQYIVESRAVEQIIIILSAVFLVLCGFSVPGVLFGNVLGFVGTLCFCLIIFNKKFSKIFCDVKEVQMSLREEIIISKKIISFSIPIILIAISEIGIYSSCTIIMPLFITVTKIGYFGIAEPISRLPMMISSTLATTMLPTTSKNYAQNNKNILEKYTFDSIRYNILITLPLCILIIVFSKEIILLLFFTKPDYVNASMTLSILTGAMFFYSIFVIVSSIIQGINKPKISMYLIIGTFISIILLSFVFIPIFNVNGGALATFISLMTICVLSIVYLNKFISLTGFINKISKIGLSGIILTFILILIPKSTITLILSTIIIIPIYLLLLLLFKGYTEYDLYLLEKFFKKIKTHEKYSLKMINLIKKHGI